MARKRNKSCPIQLPGELIVSDWEYQVKALYKQNKLGLLSDLCELVVETYQGHEDESAAIYLAAIAEIVQRAKYEYEYEAR